MMDRSGFMPSPNRPKWSPELFEQITDLLAEALFQDYQRHVKATVNSPQGNEHTMMLTSGEKDTKR
jgi:hypothetical protein